MRSDRYRADGIYYACRENCTDSGTMLRAVMEQRPGDQPARQNQNNEDTGQCPPAPAQSRRDYDNRLGSSTRRCRIVFANRSWFTFLQRLNLGTPVNGVFIDVLFLSIMKTHERFDRFDNPLCIPDQIPVGLRWAEPLRETRQEPCQMKDFAVGAAHGAKAMIVRKKARQSRIDGTLVFAFVRDNLLRDEAIGLQDRVNGRLTGGLIQQVGDLPQPIEACFESLMILAQIPCGSSRHGKPVWGPPRTQRPKGIEDYSNVDGFLRKSASDGSEPAKRGRSHGSCRKRHSRDDALQGNAARAPRNGDCIRDTVEPVDENDDIRRSRRSARSASTHRYPDVRRRQSRSIINAIADHKGRMTSLLACDRINFVRWHAIGENRVEIERGADCLGRIGAIARHHDDPRHSRGS